MLTWIWAFQDKLLYLVVFSLYSGLFLTRKTRSHVRILIYRTRPNTESCLCTSLFFCCQVFKTSDVLGPFQTPLHSCAEPNWWVKYGRRAAFESVRFGRLDLQRQTTLNSAVWEAISVKSGMSSRLVIEKSIGMVEFIDWWLKTSIAVIEIIDWSLKVKIAMVEIIDCWLRIMVAMVQKTIEYQDWRLLLSRKRLVSENDYTEVDDPERLPLWSRMERPGNKRGIVPVF